MAASCLVERLIPRNLKPDPKLAARKEQFGWKPIELPGDIATSDTEIQNEVLHPAQSPDPPDFSGMALHERPRVLDLAIESMELRTADTDVER